MKLITEFKEFAVRGNVVDLAVGVIIGGAFNKIVSSLVNDIIMPPLGVVIKGIDFKNLKFVLSRTGAGAPDVTLNYGSFIQQIVEFIIVAFAVFALIKAINMLRRSQAKEAAAAPVPPAPTREEVLLTEIRDILRTGAKR